MMSEPSIPKFTYDNFFDDKTPIVYQNNQKRKEETWRPIQVRNNQLPPPIPPRQSFIINNQPNSDRVVGTPIQPKRNEYCIDYPKQQNNMNLTNLVRINNQLRFNPSNTVSANIPQINSCSFTNIVNEKKPSGNRDYRVPSIPKINLSDNVYSEQQNQSQIMIQIPSSRKISSYRIESSDRPQIEKLMSNRSFNIGQDMRNNSMQKPDQLDTLNSNRKYSSINYNHVQEVRNVSIPKQDSQNSQFIERQVITQTMHPITQTQNISINKQELGSRQNIETRSNTPSYEVKRISLSRIENLEKKYIDNSGYIRSLTPVNDHQTNPVLKMEKLESTFVNRCTDTKNYNSTPNTNYAPITTFENSKRINMEGQNIRRIVVQDTNSSNTQNHPTSITRLSNQYTIIQPSGSQRNSQISRHEIPGQQFIRIVDNPNQNTSQHFRNTFDNESTNFRTYYPSNKIIKSVRTSHNVENSNNTLNRSMIPRESIRIISKPTPIREPQRVPVLKFNSYKVELPRFSPALYFNSKKILQKEEKTVNQPNRNMVVKFLRQMPNSGHIFSKNKIGLIQ